MQAKQTTAATNFNSKYEEINVDPAEIPAHYESVIKLKRSLEKIEMLIGISEDDQEKEELNEMKNGVLEAMTEELAQIKQLEQACKVFPLSAETIKEEDVGKLTKCFI